MLVIVSLPSSERLRSILREREREREREKRKIHIIINYTRTIIEQSHACFEYAFKVVFGNRVA